MKLTHSASGNWDSTKLNYRGGELIIDFGIWFMVGNDGVTVFTGLASYIQLYRYVPRKRVWFLRFSVLK